MRLRPFLLVVTVAAALVGVQNAYAAVYTHINNPWAANGAGPEQNLYYWMTHNYGTEGTDWFRLDDSTDQVWFNPNGHAIAMAKYAGNSQNLRYCGTVNGVKEIGANIGITTPLPHTDGGEFFKWQDYSGGVLWSSVNAENATDGRKDHMVSFRIGAESAEKYVIAFEDLRCGDYDYNDLIVEVQYIHQTGTGSVPEPTAIVIWSLLAGLNIVLGCWRRRRAA